MIFKVYNSSNSMIAVYSITHSTYQKNFDAKVKSLHNSYTTDIHINKEQFGVLSVKFIITASDLVKIHKLYTFQSNPRYRLTFLDPETDFEYNIHCTSPFQQNRLGLKDVVSYFEFNLTADIIGLGAFPTYKTGDASFWTQWTERWEVGPIANQSSFQSHDYYSNKFNLTDLVTPPIVNHQNAYILESSSINGIGDGNLHILNQSIDNHIHYDLSLIPDYGKIRITLNSIRNLSPNYRHSVYMILRSGNYIDYSRAAQVVWTFYPTQVGYRYAFYDGVKGSAPVYQKNYVKSANTQNPINLWIEHSTGGTFKVSDLGFGPEGLIFEWASNNYISKITDLQIGFSSYSDGVAHASIGTLLFSPDSRYKVVI